MEAMRNCRVFVHSISVAEANDFYDVCGSLFWLAGRLVARRKTDALIGELRPLVADLAKLAEANDLKGYSRINPRFHTLIPESSGNITMVEEYQWLVRNPHLFRV